MTFPTRMSSVLVQSPVVASKAISIPESTEARLNFRQRLTQRRRRLRQDCVATVPLLVDRDASGCGNVNSGVLGWLAFGGMRVADMSLAKPRAATK